MSDRLPQGMKELEKGQAIAFHGREADTFLKAFRRQIKKWGLALPPTRPMIWDFGLGDFAKTGLIESWIANEEDAGYCGKLLFLFDGQTCPMHGHKEKHETFYVLKGTVSISCAGETRQMSEGDVLAVPPGTKHSFTGMGPALLLELSMPCVIDDNYFENTDIPIGGNYTGSRPKKAIDG